MPCTEPPRATRAAALAAAAVLLLLGGCTVTSAPPPAPAPAPARAPSPPPQPPQATAPALPPPPASTPPSATRVPRYLKLDPPSAPRSAAELQLQFARRLVAAHPETSYTTRAPERLLAIPVLEVELNADGSVRRIEVLRRPSTGDEATRLAIDAVRRAAPYGNVSRLPRPWKLVEVFLFDDTLRFKPRTLDM